MQAKTKVTLDDETIQKINQALDKHPIGQDKLANAKRLADKGVLTTENIEKVLKKAKKIKND